MLLMIRRWWGAGSKPLYLAHSARLRLIARRLIISFAASSWDTAILHALQMQANTQFSHCANVGRVQPLQPLGCTLLLDQICGLDLTKIAHHALHSGVFNTGRLKKCLGTVRRTKNVSQSFRIRADQIADGLAIIERPRLKVKVLGAIDGMEKAGLADRVQATPGLQDIVRTDEMIVETATAMTDLVGLGLLDQECPVLVLDQGRPPEL